GCTGIKSYILRVYFKSSLKTQNNDIGLSHENFGFSTIPFGYVSAPLSNLTRQILHLDSNNYCDKVY
ncbi:hypothetical protein, partial [Staphylococcus pseudintermedius]|uniref:hypothetical protein n=1 Tax=Staphylococcus pseudintermedius TaxID=283734 RepID=UPI001A8F5CEB